MKTLQKVLNWYLNLKKRNKILVGFAVLVVILATLECLTGCSAYKLSKTWSF